jgi:D-serine dehydratase
VSNFLDPLVDPLLNPLLDPILDNRQKGFPHASGPLRRSQVGRQGWNVLQGDLPFPIAVVRQERLRHNLQWMQTFARAQGVELAPHGKTTLSPQLFQRQLDAGAWGMTLANVTQLQVALAAGAKNCLIANQVFAANDLAQINHLKRRHAGLRIVFLVDSLAQLASIEQWHAQTIGAPVAAPVAAPLAASVAAPVPAAVAAAVVGSVAQALGQPPQAFEVLLEIGVAHGRTGCREHAQALQLAQRIKASPAVQLVGLECYEGLGATGQSNADLAYAADLMQRVTALALASDAAGLFEADEVLLSAGGSAIFDLVSRSLTPKLSKPVRGVLRSGCYITHDQGGYQRYAQAMQPRLAALGCGSGLQAALEVWAAVQSTPEPGLAILTVGKRDISYDQEMPSVLRFCKRGSTQQQAAPAAWKVSALNDQHAYLRTGETNRDAVVAGDAGSASAADEVGSAGDAGAAVDAGALALRVGDLVCLGISHPCTTFDKWRWMPLVDEDGNVVDALTTCF